MRYRTKVFEPYQFHILEVYKVNDFQKLGKSVVYDYIEEKLGSLPGTERNFRNYINILIETEQLKFNGNKRIYYPVVELPYGKQHTQIDFGEYRTQRGLKLYIFATVLSANSFKYCILQDRTFTTLEGWILIFFLRIINRGFGLIRLIVLARILSPNDFGLMGIALLTMSTIETFTQIGFQAALIQKKEDIKLKLREAYLKVLQFTAFLSFPIAGLIFILAPDFTKIFLGEKWMPMVPAIQVLVFEGLIRSLAATTGSIFQAVGKPKIETRRQVVPLFVMAVLIYPFTIKWEILGASIVVFLSIFISNIGFSFSILKITRCGFRNFAKVIVFPLINGIVMVPSIFALNDYTNTTGILSFFCLLG